MIKIFKKGDIHYEEIFKRNNHSLDVSSIVKDIICNVRSDGDRALKEYSLKFDKAYIDSFEVNEEEMDSALKDVEDEFLQILLEAAKNITEYHSKQLRQGYEIQKGNGAVLGQIVMPLEKVGIYVPGGTAAYPSTVLMNAIPAKIAGVAEVVMVTPPNKEGKVNPYILAAAKVAGVDRVFRVGGAQAIAALAYGTESVPQVDKIVGPGNAFVAEAKKQVFGQVAIDMIAGPSEILVISDSKSDPKYLASDLLSQAEHDKNATAVLVTDSSELAERVQMEVEEQLKGLPREEIARASIDNNGKIIVCASITEAIEISNRIAPEHLEISTDNPFELLKSVKNAGSVFLGRYSSEPLGDYFAGPNHTLPTMGTARFSSPLSVEDFVKTMQYSSYSEQALKEDYSKIAYFARKEGLEAHARAVESRFCDK
ncbi:MAG: histidinol dehydrogenase [Clostridiales bacterium]|nr:histidinol dehydrogenase [Clostridiales bacterium]